MIETENLRAVTRHITNQQLFSETYLQELGTENLPTDDIQACRQTIRDWREEYPNLENYSTLKQYVGQCLSTLGLLYKSQQTSLSLYTDLTQVQLAGICLLVSDSDLGRTTKGEHHQANLIKQLRDASLHWGMITNGKRWRLCHAVNTAPYEVFLEIDLDELIQEKTSSDFSLFYLLFGQHAFTINSTKINDREQLGLDLYLKEAEMRVETIQRDLHNNVESILQSLCLGFVQDESASTYTRKKLDEIYQNAIYLLYRILFLFYAEARELLPIHDEGYQRVSLATIIQEARQYQQQGIQNTDSFSLWKQLSYLCGIVDYGKDALGIRPYNGGLFSDKENPYLKTHKIANAYLAPALFALSHVKEKTGITSIDYRDLSVRHLGTLYEGLLEYRLNLVDHEPIVIRENKSNRVYIPQSQAGAVKRSETILEVGKVYFADDKGERESSGSYYTPEDVVQYIVSNTVLLKLQECSKGLENLLTQILTEVVIAANEEEQQRLKRYADDQIVETVERKILSLRVLDPAMGSAHFLVAAGQVMTNFIVETLNVTAWSNRSINSDPLVWKRRIVERCLYGVDVNPLAHELAKLALWLNSASTGKPLTFLDHHLKVGNSLYGAPLNRLSTFSRAKKERPPNLFQPNHEQTIQIAVKELGKITGSDSDDIEIVKYKSEVNSNVTTFTQHMRDIANVWLAGLFGLKGKNDKPLTEDEYQEFLEDLNRGDAENTRKLHIDTNNLLREAREIAEKEQFFHWELEFPDAVVDGDEKCQFDVIVANPPYVGNSPNQAITTLYETAKCGDLYAWIFERSLRLLGMQSNIGMILPLSATFSRLFRVLRHLLLSSNLRLFLSSYDNIPDSLFNRGKTSDNTNRENSQRTTIILAQKRALHPLG